MTELAGADRIAPGALEAWRRHLAEEVDPDSPRAELALEDHATVDKAAVVGVPSERWGEEVVAFVVPARDGEIDQEELTAHARERLSAYKCPKRIFTIEQLPRNEMGKVLRDELVHIAGNES